MSGHSHASNIKHKKDRHDKNKSEAFLKLRKKIEKIISLEGNYEKAFLTARENNFSKEKVKLIIEKINNVKQTKEYFSRRVYKSKFGIIWCLEGFFNFDVSQKIESISKNFNLENISDEKIFKYLYLQHSLLLKYRENVEDLLFSYVSSDILGKIIKIERIDDSDSIYRIIFSDSASRDIFFRLLKSIIETEKFWIEDEVSFFSQVNLKSNEEISYFLELKGKMLCSFESLKVTSNTFIEKGP